MRYKKFEGEKLYFSPLDPADCETFTKWVNDETLTRGIGNVSINISELGEKAYLEKASSDPHNYGFSLIRKSDDMLVGTYGLHAVQPLHRYAEVGGFIGEITERGKGYGTEALRMSCDYGFNVLNLNCIVGKVFSFNKASCRHFEKLGFNKVGEIPQRYYYNGEYHSEIIYQITKDEFYAKFPTYVKPY